MISGSKEQLQQELEYTLLKPGEQLRQELEYTLLKPGEQLQQELEYTLLKLVNFKIAIWQ